MITIRIFILIIFLNISCKAQSLYFPPLNSDTWDTISPTSIGWCPDKINDLLSYLGNQNTKAFILLKDGKIIIEKYYGTFTKDSSWYWASAGKTLTAFLVGIAQQEGFLSINDTTSKYLGTGWTNCTVQQEEKITIKNQLSMTSGLNDGVPDHHCTLDTCLNYLTDAGTRWAYHNGPYTLLDNVMQNATGQTLNNFATQKLKNPTGITGAYFPSGYNNVFVSKARSMARFGLLMLNNGNWNGNQLLTDANYFNQMVNPSQTFNKAYGYLWWLNGKTSYMIPTLQLLFNGTLNPDAPSDMIAALGKNGQLINVSPSTKLVFIRMGNAPGVGEVPINFNDSIWKKINLSMCGVTDVNDREEYNADVKLFPNPASNQLYIQWNVNNYKVQITDISGRKVFEDNDYENSKQINSSQFESGVYFIKLINNKEYVRNLKLIVQK
jgi:CubicO group peptidase (beta-lactamase class C family)